MAWQGISQKTGKPFTLLNPSEKGAKYAKDLKLNKKHTNDGQVKKEDLTREERAYRSGYLDAQKDSARAWKAKQKKANS